MDEVLLRALLVLVILVGVALAGRWWRAREGRMRATAPVATTAGTSALGDAGAPADVSVVDRRQRAEIGLDLAGARAGAVLLTSPTCGSCAQVQGLLGEISEDRDDLAWVTVDASEHLDLARRHRVMRVPTLLVVDAEGHLRARTSGVPARTDLEQVLDGVTAEQAS